MNDECASLPQALRCGYCKAKEQQLNQAKENLDRLREEFKNEPELLSVYEPSAIYLVELLSQRE